MVSRKICIVTGSRSEYGLLRILMEEISNNPELELQIVVTGMHLSPEFGLTYKEIENDGFVINRKVEMQLSSDTPTGITKSTGLGVVGFADVFADIRPDILVILGDRYESFAAVITALFFKIPVAHLHGGETTEGAFDEAIRHSITKMAYLHFVSTEEYRKRVIQLGEHPDRVFNVGALGCQSINKQALLSKEELEEDIDFKFESRSLIVTYHPETLGKKPPAIQFSELLAALDVFPDIKIIFSYPNSDTEGRLLIEMINEFCSSHPNSKAFKSLGSLRYLSCLKYVDGVIGNSSSAIIELPSYKKGAVNIGNRQKGRVLADNIINCHPEKKAIQNAINQLFSDEFKRQLENVMNPYENGNTSGKIVEILKSYSLHEMLAKSFCDLEF